MSDALVQADRLNAPGVRTGRRRWWRTAAGAAALALATYAAGRAVILSGKDGIGPDGGFYVVHSWLVRDGLLPYRDFRISYTPGILYFQGIYASVFGETRAGLRGVIWIQHAVTLGLLLLVLRRYGRFSLAVCALGAALFLGCLSPLEGFLYVLEPHVNVFIWLSLAIAIAGAWAADPDDEPRAVWPLLSGLAAGVAFFIKQPGIVALPLAMLMPSLCAGRWLLRPLLWAAAGFAAVPCSFFLVHPDALRPALAASTRLLQYARSQGPFAITDHWQGIRLWNWLIPLFPIAALAGVVLARNGRDADRKWGRVAIALCFAGFALLLPSFLRPYKHYLLLSLPFAVAAGATCVRALGVMPRRTALAAGMLAPIVIFAGVRPPFSSLERVLIPGDQVPTYGRMEESIGAFVRRYSGNAPRILVAPNAPQYYLYAGRPGDPATFKFDVSDDEIRRALAEDVPAFIVDRGGADIPHLESVFRSSGYRLVAREPLVSAWQPGKK